MHGFEALKEELQRRPRRWLVTGAAGFIGSHLVEQLLELGQLVRGVDNFSTGHPENVVDVVRAVGSKRARCFELVQADLRHPDVCRAAVAGVDRVLHQAALGSVPRSVEDPLSTHASNVDASVQLLEAARQAGVERVVYASSSSVYGDDSADEKREERLGRALSPYATSKRVGELYADVFWRAYGLESVGLRYFNVFGPRQDPAGAYAAVIPRWTRLLLAGEPCVLYGDGGKTRDFCYVDNVVQANLLAALAPADALVERVFNVACGQATRLDDLYRMIRERVAQIAPAAAAAELSREPPRAGDIESSLADITRARAMLGYQPTWDVAAGLDETVRWFASNGDAVADRPSGMLFMRGAAALDQTA